MNTTGVCAGIYDSIRVFFIEAPVVYAGPNQNLCENAAIQLNGQISGPSPLGSWSSLGTRNVYLEIISYPPSTNHQRVIF
ncbi:MAG: hypothetical protein R2779_03000 [Crocinitomicaceae bacterium]